MKNIGKFWMMPRNNKFHELMTNTGQWPETLKIIDVLGFADSILDLFSEDELKQCFAAMREHNIPLALEIGAIKEWSYTENNGRGTAYGQKMVDHLTVRLKKFQELGANLKAVAFDEPLCNLLNAGFPPSVWDWIWQEQGISADDIKAQRDAKFDFAVEHTTYLIRALRETFPGLQIGDIGTFPFADDFAYPWLKAMKDEIDFFRLDVDWNYFTDHKRADLFPEEVDGWKEVKLVEDNCREIGIPFSLIYWSPEEGKYLGSDGYYDDDRDKDAADKVWYDQIMHQFEQYEAVGGKPDQYVIETWTRVKSKDDSGNDITLPMPPTAIPEKPEAGKYTFTQSVLDFYNKIKW